MDRLWLPVAKDWRLNERHYGGLTGLNKQEMIDKVGAEQVKIWRRSFDIPPPPLPDDSPYDVSRRPPLCRHRRAAHRKPQGHDRPGAALLRGARSRRRCAPASGCSSRPTAIRCAALEKHLSNIGDEEIVGLEIPTGQPIVYELADDLSVERPLLPASERLSRGLRARYICLVGAGHDARRARVARRRSSPTPIATLSGSASPSCSEFAAGDQVDQPRRGFVRALLVGMLEQDAEFVAAEPRDARRCVRTPLDQQFARPGSAPRRRRGGRSCR